MPTQTNFEALARIRREIDGTNRVNITSKSLAAQADVEQRRGQAINKATRLLGPGRVENVVPEWRR